MSSKDSILASIRHHTGTRHEMPELTLEAITYADKLATFSEVLAGCCKDRSGHQYTDPGRLARPSS